ncbi:MAG: hypothetical protein ABI923_08155 [bacterium]
MRTFVRLRQMLASNKDLAKKLEELERKYDHQFKVVFDAIRQLMTPPEPERFAAKGRLRASDRRRASGDECALLQSWKRSFNRDGATALVRVSNEQAK